MAALTVGLTGLTVVPGAFGIDPAMAFGWFVTAFALLASAGYHARRPLLALAIAFALLALSIVLQKGLVVADVLYAWLLAGGAWLAGRAVADAHRCGRSSPSSARPPPSSRRSGGPPRPWPRSGCGSPARCTTSCRTASA